MNKTGVKVIAFIIALVLVLGIFGGALAMIGFSAIMIRDENMKPQLEPRNAVIDPTGYSGDEISVNGHFDVNFEFSFTNTDVIEESCYIEANELFSGVSNSRVNIPADVKDSDSDGKYEVTVEDIYYRGNTANADTILDFWVSYLNSDGQKREEQLSVPLKESRFEAYVDPGSSSSTPPDDSETEGDGGIIVYSADTTVSRQLKPGEESRNFTVTFYHNGLLNSEYSADEFSIPSSSSFTWSANSHIRTSESTRYGRERARLTNITYNGGGDRVIRIVLNDGRTFDIPIPARYFEDSSDDEDNPVSDIVVESVITKNAEGQRLVEIDDETPPFTLEITYSDIGLSQQTKNRLERAKLSAFVTNATGFKTPGGNRGKLQYLGTESQYPRFKATFENIQSDGTANTFGFRVQYDLPEVDDSVKGEGTAVMYQLAKEDEDDDVAPLKPNVIVESYSYGDEPITAGDEFTLDIAFKNTSASVGVENVVMTVEPGNGFSIAAASNTDFFTAMAPGQSIPYEVGLKANPAGDAANTQTDYSVTVKFAYQYLSVKEYAAGETTVKISIPVVQLDRFSIDEITDLTSVLQVGEEGYVSVPISNKGKSPTYNITGSIKMPEGVDAVAPVYQFGNLEAGKSGTVDINITVNTPGQHSGEAVIQYEDENMQQRELTAPFMIMVEEPYVEPPMTDPGMDPNATPDNAMSPVSMAVSGAGGLMVAAPIALYFIKRARLKGLGDQDEDL